MSSSAGTSLAISEDVAMRILAVEDDPFQQASLEAIIEAIQLQNPKLSLKLTVCATAHEARAACNHDCLYELVLLDYMLPGGDGDTVLPDMRSKLGPLAAIIMLSGEAQEASMQRCWIGTLPCIELPTTIGSAEVPTSICG